MTNDYSNEANTVGNALDTVFLKKNQGSNNAGENVVTDANGDITTEAKPDIPTGSSTATDITMNGSQSAGLSNNFARADHVHPHDTSKLDANLNSSNSGKYLKVDSNGSIICDTINIGTHTHSYNDLNNKPPIIEEIPFYWVDDFLTYASNSYNIFYDPNNDVQYLINFIDSNDNDSGFTSNDIKIDRLYQIPYGSSYTHDIYVAFSYDETNEEYNAYYVTTTERYATQYELSLKANSNAIPTIADNLTTDSSTQVLSAKQGKVLNDLIGNISTIINGNGS